MTSNRKALFFDIDGTLLSEVNRNVPESAKRAVVKARANGHLVFINSGRTYSLIGPIKGLVEVDGYCCGCGTRVIVDDEVLFSFTIPHERGLQIKKDIIKYNLGGILEGTEYCYFRKDRTRFTQLEQIRDNVERDGHGAPYTWEDDYYDFDKFCVFADEQSDLAGFSRALGLEYNIIDRGDGFYECVPADYSKATAIDVVLEKYGMALEDAYVFGDSTNDLPMFEHAKNCILMGHHDVELEPYATFFTKNVEDDGIEYAMKKLKLI